MLITQKLSEQYIHTKFHVPNSQGLELALTLIRVADLGSTPRQEQFSLTFQGPLEIFMPQGTYRLEHDGLGEIDLFLVPTARETEGYLYEAVFNRLVTTE